MKPLNIFYEEPNPDRWIKFDRYLRQIVRRIVRGKTKPGGVMRIALQLMKGLDKLNIPFRFNDFSYIKKHPEEIACIIGKPQILDKFKWKNPIIYGAGIFSHPTDDLDFLIKYPTIKKILVPGPWMKEVFDPFYGSHMVDFWPAGIDTEQWSDKIKTPSPTVDFLIYDKIIWQYDTFEASLLKPIKKILDNHNLSYEVIRYGTYNHAELTAKLSKCKGSIFLCEHETQGQAYQQILATNTPVLAWDKGGYWQDPSYYPHKVQYQPVTSVPYWDERCGVKFTNATVFSDKLFEFIAKNKENKFMPRAYVLENLSLEASTQKYLDLYNSIAQ
ncbi:glycosyltransferase [Pedobacter sp. HDW13]|uniref:glycosyltransferase n=1 Tax=Pedobacter sp. HDW13 TaxID=2714940 RepID=UPI00140884C8|nr:glycosyltransferase [Pedobacter sp. HDW13]QIL40664.1 glycosyltransferase [Pedobacter sp. HDW13]